MNKTREDLNVIYEAIGLILLIYGIYVVFFKKNDIKDEGLKEGVYELGKYGLDFLMFA
tara:strand:- start:805 stop:978 length:174 start_codon:yes stop_codon:yes gene_type:complete